jgi:hypothetical protein
MVHRMQANGASRMSYPKACCLCLFLLLVLAVPAAHAQVNCSTGGAYAASKLLCLIPNAVTQNANATTNPGTSYVISPSNAQLPTGFSNSLNFLTSDLGGEISQIPLASPASGIIYTNDPTLHVPVPSNESLGPILTQRADTIGRHKIYFATTYQYFLFENADGLSLKGPLAETFFLNLASNPNGTTPDALALVNGSLDLKVHQFVGYATVGLTSRIDLSVAVPILRVDMRYSLNEDLFTSTGGVLTPLPPPAPQVPRSFALQATGVGDVIVAAKANAWKLARGGGLALGVELRLPTGDAEDFLGSGTLGERPFATFTYGGKVSPHVNVGYQFNGNSELVATSTPGRNGRLPDRLLYSGGADWRVVKRLTLAVDVLDQLVFNSERATLLPAAATGVPLTLGTLHTTLNIPATIQTSTGSYNHTDVSAGFKLNPVGNLLLSVNFLAKLNSGGLRENFAPLFGVSYTF